mmetsp:Transcript_20076/g.30190  ORF Transcript_20076/g.30190 Transcript_20076/m.30190 type:complete len:112 (-) Transcript_20076:47-382(-)
MGETREKAKNFLTMKFFLPYLIFLWTKKNERYFVLLRKQLAKQTTHTDESVAPERLQKLTQEPSQFLIGLCYGSLTKTSDEIIPCVPKKRKHFLEFIELSSKTCIMILIQD